MKIFQKMYLPIIAFLGLVLLLQGCQPPENATNTSSNSLNRNTNSNFNTNSNTNSSVNQNTNSVSSIDTNEPEQYQATVTLKLETNGSNPTETIPLKAEVARNGADRRMEIAVSPSEKFVYLTKDGKQYLMSPTRKQFAELNKESLGFDIKKLMMPEQIVSQVKNLKGMEMIGEEKIDGRDAVKYRYAATTDTNTKAGNVKTESFVFVDKATGLPLRSITDAVSESSNVQGVSGLRFITEISNIKETAEPTLFERPTDYKEVQPEEIRQQMNTLLNAGVAIFGQLMKAAAQPNPSPAASPNQ